MTVTYLEIYTNRKYWKFIPLVSFYSLKYYSNWNIAFLVFYNWLKLGRYIDIHLSCLIVALVSFSLFEAPAERQHLDTKLSDDVTASISISWALDFIWHWVPLILTFIFIPVSKEKGPVVFTMILFFTYIILTDAHILYNANLTTTLIMIIFALIVRMGC